MRFFRSSFTARGPPLGRPAVILLLACLASSLLSWRYMASIFEQAVHEYAALELLEEMDRELLFMWVQTKLPQEVQALLAQMGFTGAESSHQWKTHLRTSGLY